MASSSRLMDLMLVNLQTLGSIVSDEAIREAYAKAHEFLLRADAGEENAIKVRQFAREQGAVMARALDQVEEQRAGGGKAHETVQ